MTSDISSITSPKKRVIAYVDGFNVYYGIKNASRISDSQSWKYGTRQHCVGKSLYWLDIHAMVLSKLWTFQECVRIKYFSAPRIVASDAEGEARTRQLESNERQRIYIEALRTFPKIDVILGWYAEKNLPACVRCGEPQTSFEEKASDVNIATRMVCDAYKDAFDCAFVVSADGDLSAPIQAVRETGREVWVVLPPGRKKANQLRSLANKVMNVSIKDARKCVLPDEIPRPGVSTLIRPHDWATPNGWVWDEPAPEVGDTDTPQC